MATNVVKSSGWNKNGLLEKLVLAEVKMGRGFIHTVLWEESDPELTGRLFILCGLGTPRGPQEELEREVWVPLLDLPPPRPDMK